MAARALLRATGQFARRVAPWALALLASCGRARLEEPIDVGRSFEDPQVVRMDAAAPATRFDGTGSSLMTDSGWSRPRRGLPEDRHRFLVDAVGARSRLLLVAPRGESLQLLGSCRALAAGEELTVTLEAEGERAEAGKITSEWSRLRIRLPRAPVPGTLAEIWLTFRSTRQPARTISSVRRERPHWASCAWLAVAPAAAAEQVAARVEAAATAGAADLAPGLEGGDRFAYPIAARASIVVAATPLQRSADCSLVATLSARGEVLARTRLEAGSRPARLTNPLELPVELELELEGATPTACDGLRLPASALARAIAVHRPSRRDRRGRPPDLFVYSVDTLRADAVEPGRFAAAGSPELEKFASDAVRFGTALSPSSWTLPAVTSLLTGLAPARHGVMRWDLRLARSGPETLAQRLGSRGYLSAAISHSWIVSADYGLERGFDDFFLADHFNGVELRSQDVRGILRAWLLGREDPERPLFGFVHTVDPHGPYSPPAGPFSQEADAVEGSRLGSVVRLRDLETARSELEAADLEKVRALYRGEVAYADREFGRFLDLLRAFDLYDGALVAFVSDHGEEFLEHGGFDHGRTLYREVVEVPMVIRFPDGLGAGARIGRPASTLDLPATLAAAAGLAAADFDGTDLRTYLGEDAAIARPLFMDLVPNASSAASPLRLRAALLGDMICQLEVGGRDPAARRWRYFRVSTGWSEEPAGANGPDSRRCGEELVAAVRREAASATRAEPWEPDEETARTLRAVGYLK